MTVMAWSWLVSAVCTGARTGAAAPQSMKVAGQWVALRNGEGACMDTSCGNPGGVCDRIDLWDCVPDGHDERFRIDPPGSAADCPHGCVRVGPGNVGPNPERVSLAGWCVEALLPSSSSSLLSSSGDEADACPNCPSSSQAPCNATSLAQQLTLTGSGTLVSSVKSHDGSQLCVSVCVCVLDAARTTRVHQRAPASAHPPLCVYLLTALLVPHAHPHCACLGFCQQQQPPSTDSNNHVGGTSSKPSRVRPQLCLLLCSAHVFTCLRVCTIMTTCS
jgi:hypothetical protein